MRNLSNNRLAYDWYNTYSNDSHSLIRRRSSQIVKSNCISFKIIVNLHKEWSIKCRKFYSLTREGSANCHQEIEFFSMKIEISFKNYRKCITFEFTVNFAIDKGWIYQRSNVLRLMERNFRIILSKFCYSYYNFIEISTFKRPWRVRLLNFWKFTYNSISMIASP